MTKRAVAGFFIALASAAWVIPLAVGVNIYLNFWEFEGWPLLQQARPLNSFPFLHFASQCFNIAFAWLGIVIFAWSYAAFLLVSARVRPNNSSKPMPLPGTA